MDRLSVPPHFTLLDSLDIDETITISIGEDFDGSINCVRGYARTLNEAEIIESKDVAGIDCRPEDNNIPSSCESGWILFDGVCYKVRRAF